VQWIIPSLWRWAPSHLHQSPKPQPQRWNSYPTTVPPAPTQSFARCHASNMFLHVHSDASCMSEAHARSRSGVYLFLSSHPADPHTVPLPDIPPPPLHGLVHVPSSIIAWSSPWPPKGKWAWLCNTLADLGHPQPPTPIQTDISWCAAGIINDITVKQRRSKAIDMRFNC
jgi:hypothetical protein